MPSKRRRPSPVGSLVVFPEFRAAHRGHAEAWGNTTVAFYKLKWDFGESQLPENVFRTSVPSICARILWSPPSTVETPEPLFMREVGRTWAVAMTAKLSAKVHRRKIFVVAYAIENNDLPALIGFGRFGEAMAPALRWVMRRALLPLYDRIVFGSPSARDAYLVVDDRLRGRASSVLELPSADPLAHLDPQIVPRSAIFVGELEHRKGLHHVLAAWPQVEREVPDATICIVGAGSMEDDVRAFVEQDAAHRSFRGQLPHGDVSRALDEASVLIAPSVRSGRWREQIGRPISEGLAKGLTIVTTTETGLAPWLKEHGHTVLEPSSLGVDLGAALTQALRQPLDRCLVRSELPSQHGRDVAKGILHGN